MTGLASNWVSHAGQRFPVMPVKRLFKVVNGATPSSGEGAYWDGEIPWATPEDLGKLTSPAISSTRRTITENGYKSCGTTLMPAGSLVLSTRAPIGHVAIADTRLCTNQGCKGLVPRPNVHSRYFYYVLTAAEVELQSRGKGTTFIELSHDALGGFPVPAPPKDEQCAIAEFLDRETIRIDDLIAKQNALRFAVVSAYDAELTVTVTAGLSGRNILGSRSSIVQAHLPMGWTAPLLRYLLMNRRIAVQDGNHGELHPTAMDYVSDGIPFVMASDLRFGDVDLAGCKFITEDRARKLRIGFAKPGDVLLSHKGTLGAVAMVPESIATPFLMLTPQVTYYRTLDPAIRPRYLFHLLSSSFFKQQLEFLAAGQATRAYVGIVAQRDLILLLPPPDEQDRIVKLLDKSADRTNTLLRKIEAQIALLRAQRQATITAAVAGQIDVCQYSRNKAAAVGD